MKFSKNKNMLFKNLVSKLIFIKKSSGAVNQFGIKIRWTQYDFTAFEWVKFTLSQIFNTKFGFNFII